jgi:uncharacterized oligopeptide transporter (OPT) family protein
MLIGTIMCLSNLYVFFLNKKKPALGDLTVYPVASGVIAGESLMGIVIAMLIVSGVLSR